MQVWESVTRHCVDSHCKRTCSGSRDHETLASLRIRPVLPSKILARTIYPARADNPLHCITLASSHYTMILWYHEKFLNYSSARSSRPWHANPGMIVRPQPLVFGWMSRPHQPDHVHRLKLHVLVVHCGDLFVRWHYNQPLLSPSWLRPHSPGRKTFDGHMMITVMVFIFTSLSR